MEMERPQGNGQRLGEGTRDGGVKTADLRFRKRAQMGSTEVKIGSGAWKSGRTGRSPKRHGGELEFTRLTFGCEVRSEDQTAILLRINQLIATDPVATPNRDLATEPDSGEARPTQKRALAAPERLHVTGYWVTG